jgi:hypothetical protein
MSYVIWDRVLIKLPKYSLITDIIAIRKYSEFDEFIVQWCTLWFTYDEISWVCDNNGNVYLIPEQYDKV